MASPFERLSRGGGLPPRPPKKNPTNFSHKRNFGVPVDFSPVSWDRYFSEFHDVEVDSKTTFRVYTLGVEGPVILLLHGGGFSALTWACFSGVVTKLINCRCAAIDLRGHGDSKSEDDYDLSSDTMCQDVGQVVRQLYGDNPPPIVLMGHSMGGAIAVHLGNRQSLSSLIGLVVIDVVEGTALESLTGMQSILRGRPSRFHSLEKAIEWAVKTGHIRNLESAKVSMIGQLKKLDGRTATHELQENSASKGMGGSSWNSAHSLSEEIEDDMEESPSSDEYTVASSTPSLGDNGYTWRIDLTKTERFWKGWFEGMTQLFLGCSVPKLLLLAGVDRLDRDLTIAQMQGKFQMQVLAQSGHVIHEDIPDKVAESVATFMVRNKFAEATAEFNRPYPCC